MSLYSLGSSSGGGDAGGAAGRGETLVVNVVTGKKRCEWLKQDIYPGEWSRRLISSIERVGGNYETREEEVAADRAHTPPLISSGAVLRFSLPPPSPNHTVSSETEVSNALIPPYIQTIIPAPSTSARGWSPTPSRPRSRSATPTSSDDSIMSLHDLLSAPAPTIERPTTLLATLEFPLGVGVEVGLVEEGDAAGAKFREKIEGESLSCCSPLDMRSDADENGDGFCLNQGGFASLSGSSRGGMGSMRRRRM